MSMNIYFSARRKVYVFATRRTEMQTNAFWYEWLTPPEMTDKILHSANPVQAYKNWVLSTTLYDNLGAQHIEEFEAWVRTNKENGYTVTAEKH